MKKIYIVFGIAIAIICGFAVNKAIDNVITVMNTEPIYETPKARTVKGAAKLALTYAIHPNRYVSDVSVNWEENDETNETYLHYKCKVDGVSEDGYLEKEMIEHYLR